jgi:hypothetical protein
VQRDQAQQHDLPARMDEGEREGRLQHLEECGHDKIFKMNQANHGKRTTRE